MQKKYQKQYKKKVVTYVPKQEPAKLTTEINQTASRTPLRTTEEDFQGKSEEWFSDQDFLCNSPASLFAGHPDDYFASYSHFGIHQEMLKDKIRTGSYKYACDQNKEDLNGKIVLDIGCGTGILSIFAARAGAKHVYAVDNAHIADYAKIIIKNNNLEDKITVIKGKIEEITLPVEKVDIIISEWMGYCLLYESMLDCVLYARDKWLAKDGFIMPDRVRMCLSAVDDVEYKKTKFDFWQNLYSMDMSIFKQVSLSEPLVDYVEEKAVISNVSTFLDLDLYTVKKEDLNFANQYSVTIKRNGSLDAMVVWFDVIFNKLKTPVQFTTGPFTKRTHWSQSIFYMRDSLSCREGDEISGTIALCKNKTSFRDIDIVLTVHHKGDERRKYLYKLT